MTIQDEPTAYPEWASNPPAGPPNTIVEPSTAQREKGWGATIVDDQIVPDPPVRQYFNWFQNLVYKWILWLSRIAFDFRVFGPDQLFPQPIDLPSIGAGFGPLAADDFSAAISINGNLVIESGPGNGTYSYPANSDTYWDLHQDGTWLVNSVANLAVAPVQAANTVRAFKVITDGASRTSVTSFVSADNAMKITSALAPKQVVWNQDNGLASSVFADAPREVVYYDGGHGAGYTYQREWISDAGTQTITREYIRHSDDKIVQVTGALYQALTDDWLPASTSMTYTVLGTTLDTRTKGTVAFTPVLDTQFRADQSAPSDPDRVQRFSGQVVAGQALSTQLEANAARFVGNEQASYITHQLDFQRWNGYSVRATQGIGGFGNGGILAFNCNYDTIAGLWGVVGAGFDSYALQSTGDGGFEVYEHRTADGATWASTASASTWNRVLKIVGGQTFIYGNITASLHLALTGTATVGELISLDNVSAAANVLANKVFAPQLVPQSALGTGGEKGALGLDNVVIARGVVEIDASGDIISFEGKGVTSVTMFPGVSMHDYLIVILSKQMANLTYQIDSNVNVGGFTMYPEITSNDAFKLKVWNGFSGADIFDTFVTVAPSRVSFTVYGPLL